MGVKVEIDPIQQILQRRGLEKGGQVQQCVDSEIIRLCDPYTPKKDNILIDSATIHTVIGSGKIIWDTPYARRWYYQPAHFNGAPMRGNYWFDRMIRAGGREKIVRLAARKAGGRSSI